MKFLFLLSAVLLLGLLQGPGVTQAIGTFQECVRHRASDCYALFCPRGTKRIGTCNLFRKCCQSERSIDYLLEEDQEAEQ